MSIPYRVNIVNNYKHISAKIIAMAPLITIQLLGFRAIIAHKVAEHKAMRRILDADDQQIINFM